MGLCFCLEQKALATNHFHCVSGVLFLIFWTALDVLVVVVVVMVVLVECKSST